MIESAPDIKSKHLTLQKTVAFAWQHILLLISLFIMTLGVSLAIRSALGSSVISSIPMAMAMAGDVSMAPAYTVGEYTNIMNCLLVAVQIIILRKRFEAVQLFQLLVGTVFGYLLDLNLYLTASMTSTNIAGQAILQIAGCIILGLGIALEVRCGSITMPGEGVPAAISRMSGMPFPKAKIIIDTTLVMIAILLGYIFFGCWLMNVVGPGTLFAMIFVGVTVKFFSSRLSWFDRLLDYQNGVGRYIYGLARYIRR